MLSSYDFKTLCSVCTIKFILAFCRTAAYSAKAVAAAAAKQDDYPDDAAAAAAAESAATVAAVACTA